MQNCVLIELTVPDEENICANMLISYEYQETGWKWNRRLHPFPVEVGFTNQTLRTCFKYLDLSNKEIKKATDNIQKVCDLHFVRHGNVRVAKIY